MEKKAKVETLVIPETTWYCIELKGQEEKNINRLFCSLVRKLAKNTEYKLKPNGLITEAASNNIEGKYDLQIFLEIQSVE